MPENVVLRQVRSGGIAYVTDVDYICRLDSYQYGAWHFYYMDIKKDTCHTGIVDIARTRNRRSSILKLQTGRDKNKG